MSAPRASALLQRDSPGREPKSTSLWENAGCGPDEPNPSPTISGGRGGPQRWSKRPFVDDSAQTSPYSLSFSAATAFGRCAFRKEAATYC